MSCDGMQKDDPTKSSSFVPGDCNRIICVPSIQPTTFGNADLASNVAFVLVDGSLSLNIRCRLR